MPEPLQGADLVLNYHVNHPLPWKCWNVPLFLGAELGWCDVICSVEKLPPHKLVASVMMMIKKGLCSHKEAAGVHQAICSLSDPRPLKNINQLLTFLIIESYFGESCPVVFAYRIHF